MSKHNDIGSKMNNAWVTGQKHIQMEETEDNYFALAAWAEYLGLSLEDNNNGVLVKGPHQAMQVEY